LVVKGVTLNQVESVIINEHTNFQVETLIARKIREMDVGPTEKAALMRIYSLTASRWDLTARQWLCKKTVPSTVRFISTGQVAPVDKSFDLYMGEASGKSLLARTSVSEDKETCLIEGDYIWGSLRNKPDAIWQDKDAAVRSFVNQARPREYGSYYSDEREQFDSLQMELSGRNLFPDELEMKNYLREVFRRCVEQFKLLFDYKRHILLCQSPIEATGVSIIVADSGSVGPSGWEEMRCEDPDAFFEQDVAAFEPGTERFLSFKHCSYEGTMIYVASLSGTVVTPYAILLAAGIMPMPDFAEARVVIHEDAANDLLTALRKSPAAGR
jgi:hypothetical protein